MVMGSSSSLKHSIIIKEFLKAILGKVRSYFLGGVAWLGNKGGYSLFFCLIIWWLKKDIFPRKCFKEINVIFGGHQTWKEIQIIIIIISILFYFWNLVWNQTLNTFEEKWKNNSISTFCLTKVFMHVNKKLMFTKYIYSYIYMFTKQMYFEVEMKRMV